MNDKIVYPFLKSDGFLIACRKGCPNCVHCTDVWWDYSNGIYHCDCELNGNEPFCDRYENDGTEPITIKEYKRIKKEENAEVIRRYSRLFDGKCPYTDRPCFREYDCDNCEVELEERKRADEMEEDYE